MERFHLTPAELYSLDPAFVDELQVYMEADAEYSRELAKQHDRG